MKRTLLLLVLAAASGFNCTFGQSFSLLNSANLPVNNGDTIELSATILYTVLGDALQLVNNSGVAKSVLAEITNVTLVNGVVDLFSFGTYCCLFPGTMITPGPTVIDPAMSTAFNCSYNDNGYAGVSYIEYSFYDELNPTDRISVTYKFDVTQATGIKQNSSQAGYSVYPNPSNGIFTFSSSTDKNASITEVYNSKGQIIFTNQYSGTTNQFTIDLSNQASGIYTVRFVNMINESLNVMNLIKK